MNALLILGNLIHLDKVKQMASVFEMKSLSDENLFFHAESAKTLLDKALTYLSFDIQKKIETPRNQRKKIIISDKVISASNHLKKFKNESLNQILQDLIIFSQNYEDTQNQAIEFSNPEDLKKLKTKILLITAERFS